jgi:hypothetical protein
LKKGAVDLIREEDLRKNSKNPQKPASLCSNKIRRRPDRAGHSSRTHGCHPQIESVSGTRTHGDFSDRRFYRNDRRPVGQIATRPMLTREEIVANAETIKRRFSNCSTRKKPKFVLIPNGWINSARLISYQTRA